jgi:hypothetical protein
MLTRAITVIVMLSAINTGATGFSDKQGSAISTGAPTSLIRQG